jgi:hypothetical protein
LKKEVGLLVDPQEYGESVARLEEAGWIRAQIQKSGGVS